MSAPHGPFDRIEIAMEAALLASLLGCVGYVEGHHHGVVVVPAPDLYISGGFYERGPVVHEYSHRGYESRAVVHPVVRAPERRPEQHHR